MAKSIQMDLIPPKPPKTVLETIDSKLPGADWVSVSSVAIACNVSVGLVYAWYEEGLIEGVNVGTTSKAYYKILRSSIINFYRKRLGMDK